MNSKFQISDQIRYFESALFLIHHDIIYTSLPCIVILLLQRMVFEEKNLQCGQNVAGYFPVVSFVGGIIELVLMLLVFLAFKYKFDVSSWYEGETGVKEGVTLVLPIYSIVIFYAIGIGCLVAIMNISGVNASSVAASMIKWIVIRFCIDGLAAFFLHNGVGQRAIRNSLSFSSIWAICSGLVPLLAYYLTRYNNFYIFVITNITFVAILLAFYLCAWLLPVSFLHRRPALIRFASINTLVLLIELVEDALLLMDYDSESCPVILLLIVSDFIQPFIILYAIRQDTLFWQGMTEV